MILCVWDAPFHASGPLCAHEFRWLTGAAPGLLSLLRRQILGPQLSESLDQIQGQGLPNMVLLDANRPTAQREVAAVQEIPGAEPQVFRQSLWARVFPILGAAVADSRGVPVGAEKKEEREREGERERDRWSFGRTAPPTRPKSCKTSRGDPKQEKGCHGRTSAEKQLFVKPCPGLKSKEVVKTNATAKDNRRQPKIPQKGEPTTRHTRRQAEKTLKNPSQVNLLGDKQGENRTQRLQVFLIN